jgi:hypothetical protein
MKIIFMLIAGIIIGLACCNKENSFPYKSSGKITGPDYTMTLCSGGWFIEIEKSIYNFDSVPINSNINLQKDTFPLFVRLDWNLKNTTGCTRRITIQRIAKE